MKKSFSTSSLIVVLFLSLFSQVLLALKEAIAAAEKIRIRSAVLNEDRELRIAKPESYDPSKAAYPVLYVLDGGFNFPFVQEAFEKSAPRDLKVCVQFFKQENHISTAVVATTTALLKMFPAGPPPRKPR